MVAEERIHRELAHPASRDLGGRDVVGVFGWGQVEVSSASEEQVPREQELPFGLVIGGVARGVPGVWYTMRPPAASSESPSFKVSST